METQASDRHLLQQEDIKGGNLQNKLHLEGSHISLLSIPDRGAHRALFRKFDTVKYLKTSAFYSQHRLVKGEMC